jgi:uncharacterized protein YndB with AHSA1/START domain
MKFEVSVERYYPHSVQAVWDGLTTNEAISEWLLETKNFKAEKGHKFEMTCVDGEGHLDVYRCQVLEVEAPTRMVWSWVLEGNEEQGLTEVEFRLKATDTGTTVTLLHRGDRDKEMLERFKSGWPYKLDRLAELLDGSANSA